MSRKRTIVGMFGLGISGALLLPEVLEGSPSPPTAEEAVERVIVQGRDSATVVEAVRSVGGELLRDLGIIDSVSARLTTRQIEHLDGLQGIRRIHADGILEVAGTPQPDTLYPTLSGASRLHAEGVTGQGVAVAVLDTGNGDHVDQPVGLRGRMTRGS